MKTIDDEITDKINELRKLLRKKELTAKELAASQAFHLEIQQLTKIKEFLDSTGFSHVNHMVGSRTPLLEAITRNNHEVFDLLLAHPKINVNQQNNQGHTAVWQSAAQGKITFLEKLARTKADFKKADYEGTTPLLAAIRNKCFRAAAFIVHRLTGFSIYEDNDYGQLPVHALCDSNKTQAEYSDILQLFRNNNIDINAKNDNEETPLLVAAKKDNIPALKALIENNADVSAVDRSGETFLDLIHERHRAEMLAFLHEKGMNTEWFENVKKVKEYGHVLGIGTFLKLGKRLGLGGVVKVPIGANKTAPVYTESWHRKDSYETLETEMFKYKSSLEPPDRHYEVIYQSVVLANRLMSDNNPGGGVDEAYAAYQHNIPVMLPVTTPGHGVGVAIYKDKLIYTDRFLPTGGKINECTKIFQLNDTSEAAIRNLLHSLRTEIDGDEVTNILRQHVDFDHPILETGDKLQLHGTCSYSNPRSNIEGILNVLQADARGGNRATIDREHVIASKTSARSAYRDFLYKGRFNKTRELMNDLNTAERSGNSAKANMYFDIAESYIRGHKSRRKNEGTDRINSLEIYQRLPPRLRTLFDKRNRSLARKLKRSLLYTRVKKLLRKNRRSQTNMILHEVLHQIKLQENQGQSPDLSQAMLNTYQLAKSVGYEAALKELPNVLKVLNKDRTLPKIEEDYILENLAKPLLAKYPQGAEQRANSQTKREPVIGKHRQDDLKSANQTRIVKKSAPPKLGS